MNLEEIFKKKKIIIGMVHFPPLPGTPLYNDSHGIEEITNSVEEDLISLQNGGIDGIMFCNENDRPYTLKADPSTVASMAYVIGKIKNSIKVPFGIDVLWDPFAALAIAKSTGALFIREIVTGVYASDMGFWNTNIGELYRYKKLIDAQNVLVFFNISAEFAYNVDRRPLEEIAKSVSFSSLADVILVSGPMTGMPPSSDTLKHVKENVKEPVFVNTGVNVNNVSELLSIANGAIVGTSLKKDGITWNKIDEKKVKELVDKVRKM